MSDTPPKSGKAPRRPHGPKGAKGTKGGAQSKGDARKTPSHKAGGPARAHKSRSPGSPERSLPAGLAARRLALDASFACLKERAAFDESFEHCLNAPGRPRLEERDVGFARALSLTLIRHWGEMQTLLARCLKEPLPRRAATAELILALGAAEILILETPAHAAVSSAVALADRDPDARGFKGLVNAVLRRLTREGAEMLAAMDRPKQRLPRWLWTSWAGAYGEPATRAIAEAAIAAPATHLSLKDPTETASWAERLRDGERSVTIIAPGHLSLTQAGRIDRLPGFEEGAWWVQDYAAALPPRLFGDVESVEVLDLCAAPGGKTMALAARGARVTALDRAPARLRRIGDNLKRVGLSADLVEADALSFSPGRQWPAVLLDAPCTATGTLRRHPDVAWTKRPAERDSLVGQQEKLLEAASALVLPGGCLIYCVCSLEPEEGDAQIARFLERHDAWRREPVDPAELDGAAAFINERGEVRTLPCHGEAFGGMDGFFAVRLRRV